MIETIAIEMNLWLMNVINVSIANNDENTIQ